MLGLWVLIKCVCAFASFGLVFSGVLDQSQNCEDRSDPMQQSLIGARGAQLWYCGTDDLQDTLWGLDGHPDLRRGTTACWWE